MRARRKEGRSGRKTREGSQGIIDDLGKPATRSERGSEQVANSKETADKFDTTDLADRVHGEQIHGRDVSNICERDDHRQRVLRVGGA